MKKKAPIINFGIDMKSYLLCVLVFLMLLCLSFKVSITNASGFSCDTGTLSDTCTVSSLKTITADDVISGSGNLVVANGGELRVATSSSISTILGGDITIQSGGKITGNLSLASSINLTIDTGGLINLNGKGYAGGIGGQGTTCSGCDGNGKYTLYNSSYYGGGGAHGGNGSPGFYSSSNLAVASGGASYGSTTAPTDFGSGGAGENATYYGGNGGGAIKIVVSGVFTNNGIISTNGLSSGNGGGASYPGGGAGGSIWIQANTISGSGTTTADGGGGRVSTQWGGGGGGGRIALYYTTDNSTLILSAKGGGSAGSDSRTFGGAGTIYRKQSSWASGDLTIDNGGYGSLAYSTTQFNDPIYAFGTTSVRGGSVLVFSTSTSININTSVLNLTNGNVTLSNNTTFSATTFNITSGSSTLNVIATTTNIPSFTDVTISSGASLSHATSTHALIFNANNLTINSGGTINVTGKGYVGGIGGQGTTCSGCAGNGIYSLYSSTYFGSGGAYGGSGAPSMSNTNFIAYGGTTYGSTTAPTDWGSGGAGESMTYFGGNGGGAVKITVSGTLTNNGQILANGSSGGSGAGTSYPSGGSGGSIWITTGTLSGTGTTSANGGGGKISGNIFGGGGGGGRIALYFTTDNSSQIVTSKGGGYSSDQRSIAGAGTIYKKQSSWTNGDLTIDNGGYGTIEYATTPILANLTLGTTTVRNSANLTFSTTTSVTLNTGDVYLNSAHITLSTSSSMLSGQTMLVQGSSTINVIATTTNIPSFTDITISSGASLSHATSTHALIFNANNLTINSGGLIDVSYKGYANSSSTQSGTSCAGCGGGGNYGVSTYAYGAGGAHGGNGSPSIYNSSVLVTSGGGAYDSPIAPSNFGSSGGGGGSTYFGGNGGGAVKITVSGTLTNNGQILANGQSSSGASYTNLPGAGAGGSIWITTGTLSGTGTTSANGGVGHIYNLNGYGGSGGGGRIAIFYTTDNSAQSINARGGGSAGTSPKTFAGAGTIYKKQSSWTNGDLTIDNGGYGTIEYATTPILANLTLGTTTVRNSANLTFSTSSNVTLNAGNLYLNSGNVNLSSSTIQSIIIGTNMYVSGGTSTLNVMATTTNPPVFNNVNILSGGVLSHSTSSYPYIVFLRTDNLTINSGGAIDASSRGYTGGTTSAGLTCPGCLGAGAYITNAGGGGAHGGSGGSGKNGASTVNGGSTYGSTTEPLTYGSGGGGGGSGGNGGAGGGAIKLIINSALINNGVIKANGGNGTGSSYPYLGGGGSGGSVWIRTGSISCTGTISVNGGSGYFSDTTHYGGGGGGGRLVLYYVSGAPCGTFTSSPGTASGSFGQAQEGTVYSNSSVSLTTDSASQVTATSTVLNGTITSTGGANATVRGFEYGLSVSYGSTTIEDGSFGIGSFSANVEGLSCNTTYHFRAYADNVAGTSYGNDATSTTSACLSRVITDSASSISSSTAVLNATIDDTGGALITVRGFEYGLTSSYGSTTTESGSFGTSSFSYNLSGLNPNMTYHFRAYASSTAGVSYGDDQQFVTSINTPSVSTGAVTDISATGSTFRGSISDTGGSNILARGFYYGLTTSYGATTTEVGSYTAGDFSSSISDLTCNTSYHVKAYATNSLVTGYGNDVVFTTMPCATSISNENPSTPSIAENRSSGQTVSSRVNNLISIGLHSQAEELAKQYGIKIDNTRNSSSSTTKMYFTSDPGRLFMAGDKHEDIKRLQIYLNSHGYIIANSGPGSVGKETNLFGSLTKKALIKFQKKNKIPATGNFGAVTRKFINKN